MTRLREDHVPPRRLLATTVAAVVAVPLAVSIGTATAQAASLAVEAEALSLPTSAGQVFVDRAASGGAALLIWSPGTAAGSATIPASSALVVRARGDQCQGAPLMTVTVDGTSVGTVPVASAVWQDYTLAGAWTAGTHQVRVGYPNDYRDTTCDRNLRVDSVAAVPVEPAAVPVPVVADPTNPFVGARPWVDPQSPASVAAAARRTSDPAGAAALDRVAAGGRADWYSEWASV